MGKTKTGTVKWFSQSLGYGYIIQPGKPDLFFHIKGKRVPSKTTVNGEELILWEKPKEFTLFWTPKSGDKILYSLGSNKKGPIADAWMLESVYESVSKKT